MRKDNSSADGAEVAQGPQSLGTLRVLCAENDATRCSLFSW